MPFHAAASRRTPHAARRGMGAPPPPARAHACVPHLLNRRYGRRCAHRFSYQRTSSLLASALRRDAEFFAAAMLRGAQRSPRRRRRCGASPDAGGRAPSRAATNPGARAPGRQANLIRGPCCLGPARLPALVFLPLDWHCHTPCAPKPSGAGARSCERAARGHHCTQGTTIRLSCLLAPSCIPPAKRKPPFERGPRPRRTDLAQPLEAEPVCRYNSCGASALPD